MLNILRIQINLLSLYRRCMMICLIMTGGCFGNSVCEAQGVFNTVGYHYQKSSVIQNAKTDNGEEDEEVTDEKNVIELPRDSLKASVSLVAYPLKTIQVTSPFGMRRDPMSRKNHCMHSGLDLKARYEEVYSMLPGVVTATNYSQNGGYYITVNHGSCVCSYLHLSKLAVKTGEHVSAGQKIAISGNTGKRTTGPHLHISCRLGNEKGKYFNPMLILGFIYKQLSNK
jgi:murein DD-endopeptidase MepM/ murein hydrolase activator NlpD